MMQKYIHSIGQTVKFEEQKDFELEIQSESGVNSEAESASQSEGDENVLKESPDEIHLREQFFERSSNFKRIDSDHTKMVTSVLNDLNLFENARFNAFVAGLGLDSSDLSKKPMMADIK